MNRSRKTVPAITRRALDKCQQMYRNGLVAYCTPVEYVALCWYFNLPVSEYFMRLVRRGISGRNWRYFRVPESTASAHSPCEYAMLSTSMEV
jgi:hypothetical protein